jgi:hypothetical protein
VLGREAVEPAHLGFGPNQSTREFESMLSRPICSALSCELSVRTTRQPHERVHSDGVIGGYSGPWARFDEAGLV